MVSLVRIISDTDDISSAGTIRAAIIATCPILMAALGGLWAERAGVVNIGLEGQMILGTWGAAFFAYHYGPWVGVLGAALFGMIGGLLHAVATVSFGVDHIVSGVAVNLIGAGVATFLAEAVFRGSRRVAGPASWSVSSRRTGSPCPAYPTLSLDLAEKHWFFVSDVAAFVGAP